MILGLIASLSAAAPTIDNLDAAAADGLLDLERCETNPDDCESHNVAWAAWVVAVQRYVEEGVADGALAAGVDVLDPALFRALPDVLRDSVTEPPGWMLAFAVEPPPASELQVLGHPIVWASRTGTLKPGFYRNLDELRDNAPSIPLDGAQFRRDFWGHGWSVMYTELFHPRFGRKIGKVLGYCDGQNVWINTRARPGNATILRFAPVTFAGPYAYYADNHGRPYRHNLLNLDTGRWLPLGWNRVQWLFGEDEALWAEYQVDQFKYMRFPSYLVRYFDRRGNYERPQVLPRGRRTM